MTSRDEALRALEKKLRDEAGQHEINALEADSVGATEAACGQEWKSELKYGLADELAALLTTRHEVAPVAWLIRDRKTKVVWMDENSHFGSEAEATICAMDMNDEIDDADFEAFAVYTSTGQTSDAGGVQLLDEVAPVAEVSVSGGYATLNWLGPVAPDLPHGTKLYTSPGQTSEARDAKVADLIEANKMMRAAIECAILDLGRDGANMVGGNGRHAWADLRMCLEMVDRAAMRQEAGDV